MARGGVRVGAIAILATLVVAAADARAAVTIGETFPASEVCSTTSSVTFAQSTSPAATSYAVPSPGVITSYSHFSVETPIGIGPIKFKVFRRLGAETFRVTGESAVYTPTPGLNTVATRIPVQAGDLIGLAAIGVANCFRSAPGFGTHARAEDVPPGGPMLFGVGPSDRQLDIAATLEPDADGDGFGDETQDGCPTEATRQSDCTPPETTITVRPKAKTRSKKASLEFSSSEPGSSFRCSLDGRAFEPCTSPQAHKVKRGNHTFTVLASDAAGNVDPTPATAAWKVKKKRKRR